MQSEDLGMKIVRLAKALTPWQLAELLANKETTLALGGPSFLMNFWRDDPGMKSLIDNGLIAWGKPPKGFGRDFGGAKITMLGEQVLLCRCETEMRHALPEDQRDE